MFPKHPTQVGLLVSLESGTEFVLSRGLYLGLMDFYVMAKADVDSEMIPELLD
jgi:hypothetical protein